MIPIPVKDLNLKVGQIWLTKNGDKVKIARVANYDEGRVSFTLATKTVGWIIEGQEYLEQPKKEGYKFGWNGSTNPPDLRDELTLIKQVKKRKVIL